MNVALKTSQPGPAPDRLFAVARDRLPGAGPVAQARARAFEAFAQQGLPNRRIEQWKYTDLRAKLGEVAPLAPPPGDTALAGAAAAVKKLAASSGALTFVLVDGVYAASLSANATTVPGVRVRSLREFLDDPAEAARAEVLTSGAGEAMESLNAAMATDGLVIEVAAGAALTSAIRLVHVATRSAASAFTRSVVTVGRGAQATVVEQFVAAPGAAGYQSHDALVVRLAEDARLQHVRLMEEALDAANISHAYFTLDARARLNSFNLTRGAGLSRYQGVVTLAGEGGELATNGVNLLGGQRHGDTTLLVDHQAPGCVSREAFRSVLDQQGHSVFQGRIVVRPGAQQTDGKMMTRALLLSDEAEIDNKPELEIFADDVSCGHGATAGALDQTLLFYLMARGLPEVDAQAMLIEAFVGEAIETIADDAWREVAFDAARRWLSARD
ncbi:MAG: Fe-S cluster assembly protein SufD [Xanthobacteraceae bacterium]|nr:Fe-S cluster assembly protein SufD [Xanthobacteraceae bacterium]